MIDTLFFSDIYKSNNIMKNFSILLDNVFRPLFEVSVDPSSHPELHSLLQYVTCISFITTDIESNLFFSVFIMSQTPEYIDLSSLFNSCFDFLAAWLTHIGIYAIFISWQ